MPKTDDCASAMDERNAMRIMSCNTRCEGAKDDGDNHWVYRNDLCARVMLSRAADVICCQEVWEGQVKDLRERLKGYAWVGTVDEPRTRRPVNSIFYRPDRLELISSGAYWLSQTPHVCGSRSWESACVRLATWARLIERESGTEFRVVNTHLDHVSQAAREGQAGVINEDAAAYPKDFPQLLTGDMNAEAGNPAIVRFREAGWRDTWQEARGEENPGRTFHGFEGPAWQGRHVTRIDWIFARGPVRTTAAEVVRDHEGGRYPSDHYFITADVQL